MSIRIMQISPAFKIDHRCAFTSLVQSSLDNSSVISKTRNHDEIIQDYSTDNVNEIRDDISLYKQAKLTLDDSLIKYTDIFGKSDIVFESLPSYQRKINYLQLQNQLLSYDISILKQQYSRFEAIANQVKSNRLKPKLKSNQTLKRSRLLFQLSKQYNHTQELTKELSNSDCIVKLHQKLKYSCKQIDSLTKRKQELEIRIKQKDNVISRLNHSREKEDDYVAYRTNQLLIAGAIEQSNEIENKIKGLADKPMNYINSEASRLNKLHSDLLQECSLLGIPHHNKPPQDTNNYIAKLKSDVTKTKAQIRNIESKIKLQTGKYSIRKGLLIQTIHMLQQKYLLINSKCCEPSIKNNSHQVDDTIIQNIPNAAIQITESEMAGTNHTNATNSVEMYPII